MKPDKNYLQTLVSCLQDLQKEGFTASFKVTDDGLQSLATQDIYEPEQVKIIHYFRFEGETNPEDSSIAYGIETDSGEKGTLVDAYGATSDPLIDSFMKQVKEIHK